MIHVFVATKETQGQRKNDFCFVPEGEILTFPVSICDDETADGQCGCRRALGGVMCHRATTTMRVAAFDGSVADLGKLIEKSQEDGGWLQEPWQGLLEDSLSQASQLSEEAAKFPVGTIVEYRDDVFLAREGVNV